jgi:hypothetical protein
MLGPVIRTPLLDQMSIQLQFTLGNTGCVVVDGKHWLCGGGWETLAVWRRNKFDSISFKFV